MVNKVNSIINPAGHTEIKKLIQSIVAGKNRSHSFLFNGPVHTGKYLYARLLAMSLNCLNPIDNLACGNCSHCSQFYKNSFHYLTEIIYKFGEISINDIQKKIIEKTTLKLPDNIKQIFILNDIKFFNTESANCFLKTLEEPMPGVIFILITDSIDSVLPTIKSRCQMVKFGAVSDIEIKKHLSSLTAGLEEKHIDFLIENSDSIGACIAAAARNNACDEIKDVFDKAYSFFNNPSLETVNNLIDFCYDINPEDYKIEEAKNNLQLNQLFDKIDQNALSLKYAKTVISKMLVYASRKFSRRDFMSLSYQLLSKIENYFEVTEEIMAGAVSQFKQLFSNDIIKGYKDKYDKETGHIRKNEFTAIIANYITTFEKLYKFKNCENNTGDSEKERAGIMDRTIGHAADLFENEQIEKIIKRLTAVYFRDIASNVNPELYFENCTLCILKPDNK